MTPAFLDGLRRVARAPWLVLGITVLTVALAAPAAVLVQGAIETHLGPSLVADRVAQGVEWAWWDEFQAQASGVAATFEPRILGFAAVLGNLSDLADGQLPPMSLVAVVVTYLAAWTFIAGGVVDRLARQRPVGSLGFFAACGTHVGRLSRLAVVAGFAYWGLFGFLHGWLLDDLYGAWTRNLTVERTAMLVRLGLYGTFTALVVPVTILLDYARIRIVVEDRRSVAGAIVAAARFICRTPVAVIGLYLLNGALLAGTVGMYAALAPAPGSQAQLWAAVLVGQAYIMARVAAKLVFYASQVAFFQSRLAHAAYVARPRVGWLESPAAEAIGAAPRR